MSFTIQVALVIASFLQIKSQTCKLRNSEYNLLTMTVNETFRLPLNNYFTGDGLIYGLSPNSIFTQVNQPWGPGTVTGTIISTTSMSFNNNPNIQSFQYFALSQSTGTAALYTIYGSQLTPGALTTLSYTNALGSINSGNCYNINTIQGQIVVTCLTTALNNLTYVVYNTQGTLINSYPLGKITALTTQTFQTQAAGQYIATLINSGTVDNGAFTTTSSNIYAFTYDGTTQPVQIQTPITLAFGDFITGFSITETGLLFITTFNTGANLYQLTSQNPQEIQIFNPFQSGTLGISTYNVDYSSDFYYMAIWSSTGIVTTIYNPYSDYTFSSEQLIQSKQITVTNMFQSQVYLNARYIVIANDNGVSVYPSIFNDVNEGQLLYYYDDPSTVSSFDYYNNILIQVQTKGVYTYQFNNPVITTIQNNLINHSNTTFIKITASEYYLGVNKSALVTCAELILYYQVVSQPSGLNFNNIYQSFFYVSTTSNNYYNQIGQQYDINFGSQEVVNINQVLIGPALTISQPLSQPAMSNLTTTYSNVLQAPTIQSPYKVQSDLFDEQQVIYSQVFYDPTYISNDDSNKQFQDSYLQLSQLTSYIVLYQCSGLKNLPCVQLFYVPQSEILVQQFALGIEDGIIYFAYLYNQVELVHDEYIAHITVYSLTPSANQPNNYVVEHNTYDISKADQKDQTSVIQIAILQSNFYFLYEYYVTPEGETQKVQQTQLLAINAALLADGTATLDDAVPFDVGIQNVFRFFYSVPAYGNLLFLSASSYDQTTQIFTYYLTLANFNDGVASVIGTMIVPFDQDTDIKLKVFYELTFDGLYIVDDYANIPWVAFYPRVDLLPQLFKSGYPKTPAPQLPVAAYYLPVYNATYIKYARSTPRHLYLMVQTSNQYSWSIYVYKNNPSILNSLYYIITAQDIIEDPFSVVGALQYDAIIFRASGSNGYVSGTLLPEYSIQVKCNLNSNTQFQVEYNYVGFKAQTQLLATSSQQQATQYWICFQITNLISFVSEKNTLASTQFNGKAITLNANGQSFLDPRTFFTGNIQTFQLTNSTQGSGYYFNMIPTVVSQPQTLIYENPVTAVSAMVSFNTNGQAKNGSKIYTDASYQNQYWCTFVQTNHIVYVTPYMFYNPPSPAFVDNSTVSIDYPLTYKLPILDPSPNSQNCPLIFVDQLSQGIVSVCGTKSGAKFLVSFTIFNPFTQLIQETQIINLANAFTIDTANDEASASYLLVSATYLETGIVVLQFRYNYNFGSTPPTDIILSFIYAANINTPLVINIKGQQTYQLIQPIPNVYYIKNKNLANLYSITPFTISTQFMGGLPSASDATLMFGLLCVSNSDEECLQSSLSTTATSSSGAVITIQFGDSLGNFINGSGDITVYPATPSAPPNNVYKSNPVATPFYASILNAVSGINISLLDFTINSVQQVVQAGTPILYQEYVYQVPFVVVSKGTAYVIQLSFYITNGQFITTRYSCTLAGLTDQNPILSVSTAGYGNNYQVVAIVSNPTTNVNNQVTLLNYGVINQWCKGLDSTYISAQPLTEFVVTAIGSYTYQSVESTPVLSLMFPSPLPETNIDKLSNSPRTLISNNKIIQLLDTNPTLILTAYPDYNINQGVTLSNTTGTISTDGIQAQVLAQPIKTYVNNNLLNGATGSTLFTFEITTPPDLTDRVWFHKITGQFIWGSIMFAIIVGALVFLFYKSQPQAYY